MVHGWFLNDTELQDADWYKPYRFMPKPSSEASKYVAHLKLYNLLYKFAIKHIFFPDSSRRLC